MYDANEINEEKDAWFATAGINVKELYFLFNVQASISVVIGGIYESIHSRRQGKDGLAYNSGDFA
jgi:hypothetical protein